MASPPHREPLILAQTAMEGPNTIINLTAGAQSTTVIQLQATGMEEPAVETLPVQETTAIQTTAMVELVVEAHPVQAQIMPALQTASTQLRTDMTISAPLHPARALGSRVTLELLRLLWQQALHCSWLWPSYLSSF